MYKINVRHLTENRWIKRETCILASRDMCRFRDFGTGVPTLYRSFFYPKMHEITTFLYKRRCSCNHWTPESANA